jgi:3-hydroxyacyl-[acyl-carrier-protein] dehydratase
MSMRDSIAAARIGDPRQNEEGAAVLEFKFCPEDQTFSGHFPGRPILPGVFQLELARAAAELVFGCSLSVREIRKAKFQRPIVPGELVRLELKVTTDDGAIRARADFSVDGQPAGETVLLLCRSN